MDEAVIHPFPRKRGFECAILSNEHVSYDLTIANLYTPFAINDSVVSPPLLSDLGAAPNPKRRKKASTMSAEKWKPAETRIRQRYVKEGKSIKELRSAINAEFGFEAK